MKTLSQMTQRVSFTPGSMVQLRPITESLIWAPAFTWELSPTTTVPSMRVPSPSRTSSPILRSLPTRSFLGSSIFTLTFPLRMSWCASR